MHAFRKAWRGVFLKLIGFTLIWCICCAAALTLYEAVWPVQSGEVIETKEVLTVDSSHANEGYIMVRRDACSSGLKLRITHGSSLYTYDLNNDGEYEVFPLQMGDGTYTCTLYRHVEGNKYAYDGEVNVEVDLNHEYVPYLGPNQYVDYELDTEAVEKAEELCEDLETDKEKFDAIVGYIRENFAYDYERAASNPGFYLGDIDGCYEDQIGLCQDLSALTACMLRSQGVPTQLVIGYADKYYHAWNRVLIEEEYQLLDMTAEITGVPAKTYTEERRY